MLNDSQRQLGKYLIRHEIGRGGMGVVYEGFDPHIERRVAIKTVSKALLTEHEAPGLMQRFKREAQAAGRLSHPNIVAVFEYGEDEELAYIAMEYVEGRGLDESLQSGTGLEPARAQQVATQLLDALHYAHGLGVVHRDIKPSNLMQTTSGQIKVCDFGLAQIESFTLTTSGTVLGTPSYMSPEQIRGEATDKRADLYSAAVVLYQALTGQRPYIADTVASLIHAVLQGNFTPPTEARLGLDSAFDAVFARALAVKPDDRFQSATDFAQAFSAASAGVVWQAAAPASVLSGYEATQALSLEASRVKTPLSLPKIRKIDFTAIQRISNPDATRVSGIAAAATGRPRVLFVDDEERILSGLKLLFNQQYEVHLATDGVQALELLATHHFHVILSDQRMPGMTGTELLVKARAMSPNTVRILLTGYSDLAAIVGSVNEGEVYRFASKPWNTQDIRVLLAEAAAIGQTLEGAPVAPAPDMKAEEAVLFLEEDREIYLAARDLFGHAFRVLHAPDLAAALQVLQNDKVAVLVADIEDSRQSHISFCKLLKQEYPEIVTIVMTEASDSDLVIELINQARIFRFVNKPLKLPTLKAHVEAGMQQFARQREQPVLLQQQKTQTKPDQAQPEAGSVDGMILSSLRALRRKLGSSKVMSIASTGRHPATYNRGIP